MSRRSEVVYADAVPIQLAFPGKRPETGWPDRVSIMLGSRLPQAVWENDENRRRKVAIAFFSDEKRLEGLTNSATRGREIRAAEIVIRPAPAIPAQTGLRNDCCGNQFRYQQRLNSSNVAGQFDSSRVYASLALSIVSSGFSTYSPQTRWVKPAALVSPTPTTLGSKESKLPFRMHNAACVLPMASASR